MRITSSMMTGDYLSSLNGNLNRLSKYLEQESTGKSINSISDNPVKTTQSLSARNKLSGIKRYKENVGDADNWLTEVEGSLNELNDVIQDAYELSVRASSETLNDSDRSAISKEIAALRDEVLSTANATFGDNYLFTGYNTTGNASGELPYKVDANGDLYYNGINMSNEASADKVNSAAAAATSALGKAGTADSAAQALGPSEYNEIIEKVSSVLKEAGKISSAVKETADAAGDLAGSADMDAATATALGTASGGLQTCSDDLRDAIGTADNALAVAKSAADAAEEAHDALKAAQDAGDSTAIAAAQSAYNDAVLTAQNAAADVQTASAALMTAATAANNAIDDGNPATTTDVKSILDGSTALADAKTALDTQNADVLSLQVGSGQTMGVTVPGTELLGRGDENLYAIMDGFYKALTSGADASELNDYVTRLQDAQSRVLSLDAEVGAKLKRLDSLSARYNANTLNYTQMKSDAEDADMAEVIMNYKTAQTVYNAALSAGSEIIQTSLIDFLR